MRKWSKKLGFIAGGLVGLGGLATPALAQFQGPPGSGYPGAACAGGMEPQCGPGNPGQCQQQPPTSAAPVSLPNDGSPNGFNDWEDPCHWHRPLVWFAAEGVYAFTRREPLNVPLATTSTNPNQFTNVGAIGEPSTVVIAGVDGDKLSNPAGMRFTLGLSPTPEWMVPLEIVYLYLHERATLLEQTSDITGNPLLARPIVATQTGQPQTETVYLSSFPNAAVGGINIQTSLEYWGLQVQGVVHTNLQWGDDSCGLGLDLPVGFRYLNLQDVVNVTSATTSINPSFALPFLNTNYSPGNRTVVTDVFKGSNEFRGGEFGVRLEARWDRFFMTVEPRVDIGSTSQNVIINGVSTLQLLNGNSATTPGGILAVPTNGGGHQREHFTVLPEGDLKLGVDIFSWLQLTVGYDIAYWPSVVRAGDSISRAVDVRQIPTDQNFSPNTVYNSPFFAFKDSSFMIQGVSLGLVISY